MTVCDNLPQRTQDRKTQRHVLFTVGPVAQTEQYYTSFNNRLFLAICHPQLTPENV